MKWRVARTPRGTNRALLYKIKEYGIYVEAEGERG